MPCMIQLILTLLPAKDETHAPRSSCQGTDQTDTGIADMGQKLSMLQEVAQRTNAVDADEQLVSAAEIKQLDGEDEELQELSDEEVVALVPLVIRLRDRCLASRSYRMKRSLPWCNPETQLSLTLMKTMGTMCSRSILAHLKHLNMLKSC
jgi:hypothetical protein